LLFVGYKGIDMELSHKGGKKRVISVFVLAMLNVSIMASLRNLPLVADLGYSSLFFFAVTGLFFLIPCALVSAELATGWPESGGIYIWVREALGDRWGFVAIWMQWVHSVTWYPAILSFVATTITFIVAPSLGESKVYIILVILASFWGMTLLNYLGIRTSSLFSTIGVISGTILPGLFILSLGLSWFATGQPLQISFQTSDLIPDLGDITHLVFLVGLFLAFSGLEVSAGYAGEVKDPQRNYPKAIIIGAVITFFLFLLGSLSIAWVIPQSDISLVSGVMEAIRIMLAEYGMSWLVPVAALLLIVGAIAEVNSWIIGPVKALHATSLHGNLPPVLQVVNKRGMPTRLLFTQASIVTVATFIIVFLPNISTAYWVLTALASQTYLVMYILMFISAIVLRYTHPRVKRAYQIPHPHKGMWFVASVGLIASLFGIAIGFIPPSQLEVGRIDVYESILFIGFLSMVLVPIIIHSRRKASWMPKKRSR
jgi:amino acid transporter